MRCLNVLVLENVMCMAISTIGDQEHLSVTVPKCRIGSLRDSGNIGFIAIQRQGSTSWSCRNR